MRPSLHGAMSAPSPAGGRLRLDVVSPLPPVRSGIADYTVDLLPGLAARADVRVLALPGETPSPEVVARFAPLPLSTAPDEGRLALYQMGNNRYHAAVEERALRVPGVLVLHDLVLHHLLLAQTLGHRDLPPYVAGLAQDHGWIGAAVAQAKFWGAYAESAPFLLPAHARLLRRQRGVLVHSRWAAATIAEEQPEIRVAAVPMAVPLPALPDPGARAAFRARLGIADGTLLLGSFGFQTPIKRTDVAIRALAAPELRDVHLVAAGEVAPSLDLVGIAREAGVADRVHVTGFLSWDELEAAIAASDLCLNLRHPTAGETSAALLRVLALGRPALVSQYAQFAELPDAVAAKVPLGDDEVPGLVAAVAALRADPARLAALGEAARAYVAHENDPGRAADAVVERCLAWRDLAPLPDLAATPPPPTTLTWSRLPATLAVDGAAAPWREGERRRIRIALRNDSPARWLAGERGAGGVAVEVRLRDPHGHDLLAARPWLPLPVDLAPGETATFETEIRRPPGPPGSVELRIEPHVLGRAGMAALGGPRWVSAL